MMQEKIVQKGVDYTGIVVPFFVHDGKGYLFLTQRSTKCRNNHHKWECGGGGMKFGESPEETLKRELKEELCCERFTISKSLPPTSIVHNTERGREHWLSLPYIVQVTREDVRIGEPDMVENFGWFALDDLPKPLDFGTKKELDLYREDVEAFIKLK